MEQKDSNNEEEKEVEEEELSTVLEKQREAEYRKAHVDSEGLNKVEVTRRFHLMICKFFT